MEPSYRLSCCFYQLLHIVIQNTSWYYFQNTGIFVKLLLRNNSIIEMADDGKGVDTDRLELQLDEEGCLVLDRKSLKSLQKYSYQYLGLDMIVMLLHKLGIELTVQSRLHKGTTFKLEIPYEFPEKALNV